MYNIAYKFRIYPTNKQQVLINKTFGRARFLWNRYVEIFNRPKGEDKIYKTVK